MWKATIGIDGQQLSSNSSQFQNDDWETDPDFINDITEEEQRWGSKTVKGSGHVDELVDFNKLREDVTKTYSELKISEFKKSSENSAFGYGGKFGVQNDRMDKSAHGHDYIGKTEKHASQKDYTAGFGGKFGVQSDRLDKSAVKWDHYEKVEKHSSQKDYNAGFGGKFGVEKDRQDKSAVGWNHVEKIEKHDSQKDYTHGFGGKFGIEKDRQDKSAVGWDHHETVEKHKSQLDHKVGFGGKFGVQSDRMDKCALPFNHKEEEEEKRTIQSDEVFKKSSSIMEKKKLFESFNQKIEKVTEIQKQSFVKKETTVIKEEVILEEHKNDQIQHNGHTERIIKKTEQIEVNNELEDEVVETIEQHLQTSNDVQDSKIDEIQMSNDRHIVSNGNDESPALSDVKEESEVTIEIVDDGVIVDTGISAIALYDYQASEEDEISFDPDDIITHVEMIDKGWWRGLCRNRYGLFPANFVQLQ